MSSISMSKKSQGIVDKRVLAMRKYFNYKRYNELFKEPPKTLSNLNGEEFEVDEDIFRKLLQYVYNLAFKNLDIVGLFGGEEGTGKTTDASQIGKMFHYIMEECNVLNKEQGLHYEYNLDNCFSHNLIGFLKKCDKYNDDLFRIIICDEGGGLKGEERWDEWNKKFREEMRKDRKKLKIRLICYPQLFELVKDITMSRVNFMRISEFREDKDEGLIPDIVHTIIIPRGTYTFSWHTLEKIHKKEIKLAIKLQSKERYTKDFPKKLIYKTNKKNKVFCFDTEKYLEDSIKENRLFLKEDKIYISGRLIGILAKNLTAGRIRLSTKGIYSENKEGKEREIKDALLVSKFVNRCREVWKKSKKGDINEQYEDDEENGVKV